MKRLSDRWMYYCGLLADKASVEDLKHIQNLIDLEEQGLLIRLPCKVGDKVYGIYYTGTNIPVPIAEEVEDVGMFIETDEDYYKLEDIGKSVFFTKEEAEQALERRKNG